MIAESVRRHDVLKAERRESEKNLEIFSLRPQKSPKSLIYTYIAESKGDPTPRGPDPSALSSFFVIKISIIANHRRN